MKCRGKYPCLVVLAVTLLAVGACAPAATATPTQAPKATEAPTKAPTPTEVPVKKAKVLLLFDGPAGINPYYLKP